MWIYSGQALAFARVQPKKCEEEKTRKISSLTLCRFNLNLMSAMYFILHH